jgi:hypothetical protein
MASGSSHLLTRARYSPFQVSAETTTPTFLPDSLSVSMVPFGFMPMASVNSRSFHADASPKFR